MTVRLVCWSCGKSIGVEVAGPPTLGIHLAAWARDVGWVGILDHLHSRALVFCGDACVQAQTTKAGNIRARPRPVTQAARPLREEP